MVNSGKNPYQDLDFLRELAEQCSLREQAAVEAERESVALKKAAYMERHVGEDYRGRITGVAPFGLFVTLDDLFVEGLIHIRTMVDDYYHFEEHQHTLLGERGGQRFSLGDPLCLPFLYPRPGYPHLGASNPPFVIPRRLIHRRGGLPTTNHRNRG